MTHATKRIEELLASFPGWKSWASQERDALLAVWAKAATVAARVETKGDALSASSPGVTVESVRVVVATGGELSARERRFVVRRWPEFSEGEVLQAIGADDALIRLLRTCLLDRFRAFARSKPMRLAELVYRYEERSRDVLGQRSISTWLLKREPHDVVNLTGAIAEWDAQLRANSLRPGWQYSDVARIGNFGRWLAIQGPQRALRVLKESPIDVAARYLPPPAVRVVAGKPSAPTESARFWESEDATRVVALWLDLATKYVNEAGLIDEIIIGSDLRDPLLPNAHHRWSGVKDAHPVAYEAFVQRLSRTDIEFFFRVAKGQGKERGEFWLRYLTSIRSTTTFLSLDDRAAAQAELVGTPRPEMRLALARAGTAGGGVSAFVLRFEGLVAVEFSVSGNATYLYDTAAFEALRSVWSTRRIGAPADLKRNSALERLSHNGDWQYKFRSILARHGLLDDNARASSRIYTR